MVQVGRVNEYVDILLGIQVTGDRAIHMGMTNIQHMVNSHPDDYATYGKDIPIILASPDYVGLNPKDGSIEYVKEYVVKGEHVKVAVRLSGNGVFFARSIYVLNPQRVASFVKKGTLKKIPKSK